MHSLSQQTVSVCVEFNKLGLKFIYEFKGPRDSKHAERRSLGWEGLPSQDTKNSYQALVSKRDVPRVGAYIHVPAVGLWLTAEAMAVVVLARFLIHLDGTQHGAQQSFPAVLWA